uniref:Uncharacterized protein n=1 Tax=Heliothis virescens TaxID=7102 RepID=A0A2A4IYJ9_HELVI
MKSPDKAGHTAGERPLPKPGSDTPPPLGARGFTWQLELNFRILHSVPPHTPTNTPTHLVRAPEVEIKFILIWPRPCCAQVRAHYSDNDTTLQGCRRRARAAYSGGAPKSRLGAEMSGVIPSAPTGALEEDVQPQSLFGTRSRGDHEEDRTERRLRRVLTL